MNRRIFVDMDGTLAEWIENESTDVLYEKGYYENLKPNELLLQTIKRLINKGEDIYILSSFLNDSKYALEEKNNWLDRYLPELSKNKRIFIKYGDNKILSHHSPYNKSYFNSCQRFVELWNHVYVENLGELVGNVGDFYNVLEWVSDEEADALRKDGF